MRLVMSLTMLSVFLSFTLSVNAWASPFLVPVNFRWVRSPEIIPYLEAKRAVRHVKGYYRKNFNINLRVNKFRKQRNLFPELQDLPDIYELFFAWSDKTLPRKFGEITHVITGPLLAPNNWYSAGLAYRNCFHSTDIGNFSISFATFRSPDKHERFVHAKTVIAHELAHNLSAGHIEDCNLMDTNILACMGNNVTIIPIVNSKSKRQMKQCLTIGRQN
jgi:hypothetical protein